MQNSGWHCLAR